MARPDRERLDLWIIAAHPLELTRFTQALGAKLRGELHGFAIGAGSVGVGLAASGAGVGRLLAERSARAVLLVGSYGIYPSAGAVFEPGRLLVPSRVQGIDGAVLAGAAAFPEPMQVAIETDAALSAGLVERGSPLRGTLAVTFGITTDDALARELALQSGCVAENLEALAVGLACAQFDVRFAAVLGCTNLVGSQGRKQWLAHHALAAERSASHVLDWIARGASGL